ncbi:MAG: hypothetical protein QM752_02080 [Gammaproteobacteria bacterium]
MKEWFVPASKINKIKLELNTLGINVSALFPGLESICRDLKDQLSKKNFSKSPNSLSSLDA